MPENVDCTSAAWLPARRIVYAAESVLRVVRAEREKKTEDLILKVMRAHRTWFGLGRNYTREEAVSALQHGDRNLRRQRIEAESHGEHTEHVAQRLLVLADLAPEGGEVLVTAADFWAICDHYSWLR